MILFWAERGFAQAPNSCPEQSVADTFLSKSYSHSSGSANWSSDWIEVGESDGVDAGVARVQNNLCTDGHCLRLGIPFGNNAQTYSGKGVVREANLQGAQSAALSFVYRRGADQGSQTVILAVSNDGGSSWTELQSYFFNSSNTSAVSASFDITPYISSNTQIRFLASGNNAVIGMYIDDIAISYQLPCVTSPLLQYRFDEPAWNGTVGEVLDSSTNSNNGIAVGGITTTEGMICNAANIPSNSSASLIEAVDSGADLDAVVGSSGTISLWYKSATAWNVGSDKRLIDATDGNKYFVAEISANGQIKFWFEDGRDGDYQKTTVNAFPVGADVWKHLTFVWDVATRTAKIYLDGVEQSISGRDGGTSAFAGFSTLYFGDNRNASYFTGRSSAGGLIDEALVFNAVLTSAEIQSIFSNQNAGNNFDGSARTCPTPAEALAEYRFEEPKWTGSAGEVLDNSGNNYHGQVTNNSVPEKALPALSGNPGTCGYASQINGSIEVSGLPLDTSSIGEKTTVTFWMNWDGTDNVMPIGWDFHDVWIWNGSIGFNTWNTDIYGISNAGLANSWHHVAVEFTNGDISSNRMHIDGVEQTLSQQFGRPNNARAFVNSQLRIGGVNNSNGYDFHGLLDEFRVYQGSLTTEQIVSIMNERHACSSALPVVEYHFDEMDWEGTIGEVLDNTSGNLDGTAVGDATTIAEGPVCRAGTFDGINDYIDVGRIDAYLTTTASLAFWIKTSQSGYDSAWLAPGIVGVEQRGGANDVFWGYLDASGRLRMQKGNGRAVSSSARINDDKWHHVVMTRDSISGTVHLYIDGVLDNSATSTTGDVSTPFSSIGRIENSFSSLNFIGQLDELLVFDSVISAAQVSAIYSNQMNGDNYDGTTRICPADVVHHYEIQHDGSAFTCEAETVTIKACANESCDVLYDQPTSLSLSPSGWKDGDTFFFTGETTANLSVTEKGTVTLTKTAATPDAGLRCFNKKSEETCNITFVDSGFEFIGASVDDKFIPDQEAATVFQNVRLRAVEKDSDTDIGTCKAALVGTTDIKLGYDCISPTSDKCLIPFSDITIKGDGTGESTVNYPLTFNSDGIAELTSLSYADAGRLELSAESNLGGKILRGTETVDIYPSYLSLSVEPEELVYGYRAVNTQDNFKAGEDFTFIIGAYGVNNKLLPNYQAENPQLKVTRVAPSGAGKNGAFGYSESRSIVSDGTFNDATAISVNEDKEHFKDGTYTFDKAYYSEVGRIALDVKDANYLGNEIGIKTKIVAGVDTKDTLIIGNFYPAYFKVDDINTPTLADTCNNTFSYLGQTIDIGTSPTFTLTAYNALGAKTSNFSDEYWNYSPAKPTAANLNYLDSSSYAKDDSIKAMSFGDLPKVENNNNYDGSGRVTINNGSVRYNKVNPNDNSVFDPDPVSPFDARITIAIASNFFNSTFVNQNGDAHTICYQASHTDNTCLGLDIEDVSGTQVRYGRLVLESTYGPETEPLNVPIKAEYFTGDQWLLNIDDSNCTSIDFTEQSNQIQLSDTSFANSFNSVTSVGVLIRGVAVGNQLTLNAPNTDGELDIWLDPTNIDVSWPEYLNFDWNGDGFIKIDDLPKARVKFGLYRGNDRIIHWREVFN